MTRTHFLRPFEPTPAEYEAIVQVYNHANPHDSGSASDWQLWDQHREPSRLFTRYVVEHGGDVGGDGYSVRTDTEAMLTVLWYYCLGTEYLRFSDDASVRP
jgi:hypothetical protein